MLIERHWIHSLHKGKHGEHIPLSSFSPQKIHNWLRECSLQKGNLCACKVVQQAYHYFWGHLWWMYSNIVDEHKLYELILKYELLLHWIWISIFTEFAKRRFAWMKVSDELKMKLLHYSPVHCNGLIHPCGNCLYFPTLLWNEKNFFSKLTFY